MDATRLAVCAALLAGGMSVGAAPCLALDPTGVLVLYNKDSPDGLQIADDYAQLHPGVRLLGLTGIPTTEQVSADVYMEDDSTFHGIRSQVLAALDPSINVIVTTKGLPLRIDNPKPVGWTGAWSEYSSLESELTRVDSINSKALMGNQSYATSNRLASNPYYYKTGAFSYATYGIRLTSRLDGYTVQQVEASLLLAQNASYNSATTCFVLDDDPRYTYSRMNLLDANVLTPRQVPHTYDDTTAFVRDAPAPVLGYVSHGVHGGAPGDYLLNEATGLTFDEAPGAVFDTWESYNAYTFDPSAPPSPAGRQGLIADWIARGGTAGVGNVWEPYASSTTVTNEDRLFQELLDGYTFAEASWNATRQLSYVNTMVGDPLMVWSQVQPIPEPCTLALLALGGLAAVLRRRGR